MARTTSTSFAVLVATTLIGCSGEGSDFAERFVAACTERSNMPVELCDCLADRAQTDLEPDAQTFLVASLEGNESQIEEARAKLSITEAMQAGLFMTEAGECAASMGDPSGNP